MSPAPDILLATLNARYIHAAFGLRYLQANMAELQDRSAIREFSINQPVVEIADAILAENPRILGLGVYIWNATPSTELVAMLKLRRPEMVIVLGGPEVSYETDQQAITALADYVITGEADLAFRDLCRQLLTGTLPSQKIIRAPLPTFDQLELPYHLYTERDVAHRIVYVEASRGCPFTCEFCLSSLDIPVRALALDRLLPALQSLLDRGLRHFKFVDRTFNLNLNNSRAVLQFFLERLQAGMLLHFEMIPDRLPDGLRALIAQFPPGVLQFEVGIQTFDEPTSQRISRRQNLDRLAENFHFLRGHTGVHIHADLIVGLPGEDMETFGRGFDRLIALRPQEIQVGMLKRLRGTPIVRHDAEFGMVYNPNPPYEILQTSAITAADMQRMRRFAKYWDLVGNSGNFIETTPLLWNATAPFQAMLQLSDWLHGRLRRTDGIALLQWIELLFEFLVREQNIPAETAAQTLWRDYTRPGRKEKPPKFLKPHLQTAAPVSEGEGIPTKGHARRQSRHVPIST